jgi:hypothetical protein
MGYLTIKNPLRKLLHPAEKALKPEFLQISS